MERSWNCPTSPSRPGSHSSAHTHTGLTLFKFRPSLPSAFAQTHYVMPKGREADWDRLCKTYDLEVSSHPSATLPKRLWDHFAPIHGGKLQTWPHTLHCHEFGGQLSMLQSYTRQLWRTVWFSDGVDALNESHEVTYAISFKLVVPTPPTNSRGR
ncbi:hypothetical protein B0T14DRAFT_530247 [Immersiella caudata]|uniref:Uncharacterized protein n=1 Tax=Immersiella caudata TaxID=314043 RepID=A0AA39TL60_9PEZI|nr:hypothetical protein B0T14DRAFT_530247 [Immersiella caudata]